jgi:hypothetical protein
MAHMKSMQGGISALGKRAHRVGSKVPESGVYEVIHHDNHSQRHEVTCIEGKRFPPCRHCGEDVEFRLVRGAIHIEHHTTFERV